MAASKRKDEATHPDLPPWHITLDGLFSGLLTKACDEMNRHVESEAERQMIPHLFCAVMGLMTLCGVDEIDIVQQKNLPDVGRVDWCLTFCKGAARIGVIVELDGLAYHDGQESFARDRRRDRAALQAGYFTVRFAAVEAQQLGWSCGVELHNTIASLLPVQARKPLAIPAPAEPAPEEPAA